MTAALTGQPPLVAVVRAPVEATSSFLWGSHDGPAAVAEELSRLELHDPEIDPGRVARLRLEQDALEDTRWEVSAAVERLDELVSAWLERGAFPLTLGGEHTITFGPLQALCRRLDEPIGLVQLDAHGDLRRTFEGRSVSHACVMRRAVDELGLGVLGLGIRSLCSEEARFVDANDDILHLGPRALMGDRAPLVEALERLPSAVYLTVDMDVFDPAIAPGVGTPEAGGLDWPTVARIIDELTARRRLVGADLVELAPNIEGRRTVRLAARVAIRVLLRWIASTRRRRASDGGA